MPGILTAKKVGKRKGPVAVIDIGSNSIRLVVYDGAKRAPLPVFNEKVICGLGRDLDRWADVRRKHGNGYALLAALRRVDRFHRRAPCPDSCNSSRSRGIERRDFVQRIQRECGLDVDVLSGRHEAELSALGVLSGIPKAQGIMGDLGGGSVELVKLSDGRLRQKTTLPLGALRVAANDLSDEAIDKELSNLGWLSAAKEETFYAVGGAWRALAQIHMEQIHYPLHVIHQYSLNAIEAISFARFVGNLSHETLTRIQGLSRSRIDAVPYAARLIERLILHTEVDQLVFCAYGLREGCLFERLSRKRRSQDALIAMSQEVSGRAGRATSDGDRLSDWIAPAFVDETPDMARLRRAAANLADIGWSEHPDYRAEQVFLRILRMPLVGIDHLERATLALAVASRHSAMDKIVRRWRIDTLLSDERIADARTIGLAMRLAYTNRRCIRPFGDDQGLSGKTTAYSSLSHRKKTSW